MSGRGRGASGSGSRGQGLRFGGVPVDEGNGI